jgi:glycerol-3-phosphate dehydrogenase (NAD(P)+)
MRISVIGAGTWGTALARLMCFKGHGVKLWAREPEVVRSIRNRRINELFLSDIELPGEILVTGGLVEAVDGAEIVLVVVPSQHFRGVVEGLVPHVPPKAFFVSATKGLEEGTCYRMSEVIGEVAPQYKARVVAISGPTFAREVVKEFPTALVAACEDTELAKIVQTEFSAPSFRVYTNNDIVGVELGGAVKNVIAIASGVGAGLGLGHNSLAALVTRGLAEISRLSEAMGGRRDTLSGLAGMGDLVLTCTAELSRNRSVGYELGRGRPLDEILSSMRMIAEGVPTTHAAVTLAERHNVEMPITFQMARLLRDETTPREAIHELMSRPLREE